jgi:hypothetical protein
MLLRFVIFLAVLLLIDWYFFQSVKVISTDYSESRRLLISRMYWGFSLLSFSLVILLIVSYNKPFLPKGFMLYAVSFIMIVVLSKVVGSLFLAIDDIVSLGGRTNAKTSN